MRNYRDLEVWKIAHKLTLELYAVSKKFPKDECSVLRRNCVALQFLLAQIWLKVVGAERVPSLLDSFGLQWAPRVNLITICCFAGIWDL